MAAGLRHRAAIDDDFGWLRSWHYAFFVTSLMGMPSALAIPSQSCPSPALGPTAVLGHRFLGAPFPLLPNSIAASKMRRAPSSLRSMSRASPHRTPRSGDEIEILHSVSDLVAGFGPAGCESPPSIRWATIFSCRRSLRA
jgi:hypothetical protein